MTDIEDDPSPKTDPPKPDRADKGEDSSALPEPDDIAQPDDGEVSESAETQAVEPEDVSSADPEPEDNKTVFADAAPEDDLQRTVISTGPDSGAPASAASDPTVISSELRQPAVTVRLVEPGTLINNNYRIVSLVSSGGMGEVYRAENVFTGDPVAVKVVLSDLSQDESVLDMFRREARVLVQLRDEAIVRYHNFVLDGGLNRYCLIMEFVEGRHLGTRVKEDGPLPDEAAIMLFNRLARGLERAHARGVTHRDLSPDNVILRDDKIDEAVLIDFGIARSTELGDGLAGRFAGKFKYIAPEQLGHFGGDIQPATDVYGLALLMAMVLRGKPLDMGDSIVSASAARQTIPDLSGVSHRLLPLLQHMLEPDPQRRPATMGEVRQMLSDPTTISTHYRLPLWSATRPVDGESEVTGGFSGLIGTTGQQDSSSPFLRPPDIQPMGYSPAAPIQSEPKRSSARGALIGGATVILAAVLGLGLWLTMRDRGEEPLAREPEIESTSDLLARDTATREGFLASLPMPACSFADRIATGKNAGMVTVFSDAEFERASLAEAYQEKFGASPTIIDARVMPTHCPTVEFLREIAGRPAAPPVLSATISTAEDGYQLIGMVKADPARNLWLFLVSPDGGIYDLSGQTNETGDSRQFGVGISAVQGGDPSDASPFLLVAMTTDKPVAAVAAAPSGAPSAELLPRILDELRANRENPAANAVALRVAEPEPPAASDDADNSGSEEDNADPAE